MVMRKLFAGVYSFETRPGDVRPKADRVDRARRIYERLVSEGRTQQESETSDTPKQVQADN